MPSEVEVAMLTATFDAAAGSEEALAAALARYVVMTRTVDECRNVDLVFLGHARWSIPKTMLTRPCRCMPD